MLIILLRYWNRVFGKGVFLKEIINRIIHQLLSYNVSAQEIADYIDNNVYGIELDEELYSSTINSLKDYVYEKIGITPVLPHLVHCDALDYNVDILFDIIVGNPPYVRIHNIDKDYRLKLKDYKYSQGNSDLYVIFFEKFLDYLSGKGKFVFITPNSWLKNASQKEFRKGLIENNLIEKIIDYGSQRIFDDASTYTAITLLSHNNNNISFTDSLGMVNTVSYSKPFNKYWHISNVVPSTTVTLGDVSIVKNGLATLGDRFFIKEPSEWQSLNIESQLLLPIVKGGKFNSTVQSKQLLFPYCTVNGKIIGLSEDIVRNDYPAAWSYLSSHKSELSNRNIDKNALWFWFGRSQSLDTVYKEKIIISSSVSPSIDIVPSKIIPSGTAIYSGLMILEKDDSSYNLQDIANIINDKRFINYCRSNGKPISHDWVTISSTIVKDYPIPKDQLA